jgi:hypothetical protein
MQWLLTGSEVLYDSLISYDLTSSQLDSIAAAAMDNRQFQPGKRTVEITDPGGRNYILGYRTPETIRSDTLYPLLVYLHGGIGTSRTDKGAEAYMMFSSMQDSFPMFLASPSANRTTPWWSENGLWRIVHAVRYLAFLYPVDREKIFLAGVSDGATGCFGAANTIAKPFAGFIAVSGLGGMLPRLGMELFPDNLKQRPVYNVNAGQDHLYPIDLVKRFCTKMNEQGVDITCKYYPDEKHGFEYREEEYGELASRIRTWRLPAHRRGFTWHILRSMPYWTDRIFSAGLASGADHGTVRGYWRGDTLVVQGDGVKHATLCFQQNSTAGYIPVIIDGSRGKARPEKLTVAAQLLLMHYTLSTQIGHFALYPIDF